MWVGDREYRPFKQAREFARSLKLSGQAEWRKYCKGELPGHGPKPDDIPASLPGKYKDAGWISLG